jgi:hypothetical protein
MMNMLREVVAALRTALRPLESTEILLQAFGLPSGSTVPSISTTKIDEYLQNPDPQLEDFVAVAEEIVAISEALRQILEQPLELDAEAALETGLSALAISWLGTYHPLVYCLGRMLDVIESESPRAPELIHFDRIGRVVTDAHEYFRTTYRLQTEADAKQTSDTIFPPLAAIVAILHQQMSAPIGAPLRLQYG